MSKKRKLTQGIYQRSDNDKFQVDKQYKNKIIRKCCDTYEEAQKYLNEKIYEIDNDKFTNNNPTLNEVAKLFFAYQLENGEHKPSTSDNRQNIYNTHIKGSRVLRGGNIKLKDTTTLVLKSWQSERLRTKNGRNGVISPNTYNYSIRALLDSIIAYAVVLYDYKVIDHNPFNGIKKPKYTKIDRQALTQEQKNTILDYAKTSNYTYYIAIRLMLETGCRVGECVGMKWKNIDLENDMVTIEVQYDPKDQSFRETKESKILHNPITETFARELKAYKVECGNLSIVFPSRSNKGLPITGQTLRNGVERIGRNAGITSIVTPHIFRDTYSSFRINKGDGLEGASRVLGHSSTDITKRCYDRQNETDKLKADRELVEAFMAV